jgi:Xaa-Pro aminopeptidase
MTIDGSRLPLPLSEYQERFQKCRERASERGLNGLIILGKDPDRVGNLVYLANHRPMVSIHPSMYGQRGRGYGAVVLPVDGEPILIVTAPYYEIGEVAIEDVRVSLNLPEAIADVVEKLRLHRGVRWGLVGEEIISYTLYRDLLSYLPGVSLYPADDVLWALRMIKTPLEQARIRDAARVADAGVHTAREAFRRGRTETDVVDAVADALTALGASDLSLTCQSGSHRSGEPLIRPLASNRVLEPGDLAHMEVRGLYQAYRFDICRAAVVGEPSREQRAIIELANRLLDAIIQHIRPGVRAEEVQILASRMAAEAGYGSHLNVDRGGPSSYCGHGLGMEWDEPPILYVGDKTILREGMYLTPEPGIYRTPVGGLRLEDDVLVTRDGCEVLNKSPRYWFSPD